MQEQKWPDNRGWLFVLPVLAAVAFNAILPLMTVVNYSTQFVRGNRSAFKGWTNFAKAMGEQRVAIEGIATGWVTPLMLALAIGVAYCCWQIGRRRDWPAKRSVIIAVLLLANGLLCAFGMFEALPAPAADEAGASSNGEAHAGLFWTCLVLGHLLPLAVLLGCLVRRHGIIIGVGFSLLAPCLLPFMLTWPFIHQLSYSLLVLAIELPLGIAVAKLLPRKGLASSLALVVIAVPLLIPFAVIGYAWRMFTDPGVGLMGSALNGLGWEYNNVQNWFDSWFTIILMDVWHWTSLVALLAFAGLSAIPDAWYRAAQIDGASRWATFRHVELPKLRSVLIIAVLLRFMDSFMVFTEPFLLNAGGPGSSTEMLSTTLYNMSVGSPTSGKAAAYSLLYLFFVLLFSYILYSAMMRAGKGDAASD